MKKIILITGGERSGKSSYAEQLALSLSDHPVYLATARAWDEEFRERIKIHQKRRGPQWTNIEEEKHLSRHDLKGRVVLVDCITLWCTNFFFDWASDNTLPEETAIALSEQEKAKQRVCQTEQTLQALKKEFDILIQQEATFIFVTNEIGWGGISPDEIQRAFTSLQGWTNQYIAAQAHDVFLMVSGIPVKIK